jgi:hypothetical protein
VEVDPGTPNAHNPLSERRQRNRILRHFEQIQLDLEEAAGRTLTQDRAQRVGAARSTQALIDERGASAGPRTRCT